MQLAPVPYLPEIRLHQADEATGLWELAGGYHSDEPAPFWAFAWPGGQALARHLLDHPETVTGHRVLDLACGSGIVGIAAALAGATSVEAVDIDPAALDAVARNAEANGVTVTGTVADILDGDTRGADVVVAGDVFYSAAMAGRVRAFLRRAARNGARVLVGDPDRDHFPRNLFTEVARHQVPTRPALEDTTTKPVTIWVLSQAPS
jgi:predicted nicotinamide N-methyase